MNTKDARIANDGAIVAIPCINIPGSPTAFSRSSVLTLPRPDFPASIATVPLLPHLICACLLKLSGDRSRPASVIPIFAGVERDDRSVMNDETGLSGRAIQCHLVRRADPAEWHLAL